MNTSATKRYASTPNPSSYWRRKAKAAILAAMSEGEAAGDDAKGLTKRIDAAYPFGSRELHPYKCWLVERKAALAALVGLVPVKRRVVTKKPEVVPEGQLGLFGEEERG